MEVGGNLQSSVKIISTNQQKGSSSKFRGVLWLKSGKLATRISFKYKPYWLGTYDVEEKAAMAYDRGAIKLQRSDISLGFPPSLYTVQETKFRGQFSSVDIMIMLKGKTYLSKLTYYLASQPLVRECEALVY